MMTYSLMIAVKSPQQSSLTQTTKVVSDVANTKVRSTSQAMQLLMTGVWQAMQQLLMTGVLIKP